MPVDDQALADDYDIGLLTMEEVAAKHGVTLARVVKALRISGVVLRHYGMTGQCVVEGCEKAVGKDSKSKRCRYHQSRKNAGLKDWPTFAPHGTYASYRRGCKCHLCYEAARAHAAKMRTRREGIGIPADAPHGNVRTYNFFGCRCDECREAKRIKNAEYRAERRAGAKS